MTWLFYNDQKQPFRGVLRKMYSDNIEQIYRTPKMKCDFSKVASNFIEIAFQHGCSPVNLLHIFRTHFPKNTSGRLRLDIVILETIVILSKSFQCISSTNKDITKFYVRIRFLEYYFCQLFIYKVTTKYFHSW